MHARGAPRHYLVRTWAIRPQATLLTPLRGVGTACGRRQVLDVLGLARALSRGFRLRRLWQDPLFVWAPGRSASPALGRSSCSPSAPPLRCSGAVTPRAVPLLARSQPRQLPRPWRQIHRQPSARLRCLGPKTGWRSAGPSARDGAVPAGHLPPVQRRDTRLERGEEWRGEIGEPRWRRLGSLDRSVRRHGIRFGRGPRGGGAGTARSDCRRDHDPRLVSDHIVRCLIQAASGPRRISPQSASDQQFG